MMFENHFHHSSGSWPKQPLCVYGAMGIGGTLSRSMLACGPATSLGETSGSPRSTDCSGYSQAGRRFSSGRPSSPARGGSASASTRTGSLDGTSFCPGEVPTGGGEDFARGGGTSAAGGEVFAGGGEAFAEGGGTFARGGEVSAASGEASAGSGGLSARGGEAFAGGGEVSARGGGTFAGSGEVSAGGGGRLAPAFSLSATRSRLPFEGKTDRLRPVYEHTPRKARSCPGSRGRRGGAGLRSS